MKFFTTTRMHMFEHKNIHGLSVKLGYCLFLFFSLATLIKSVDHVYFSFPGFVHEYFVKCLAKMQ